MSKCDISIQLDDPQATYLIGDVVTGTVNIIVNTDVNCRALTIAGLWKTHGRGNTDSERYGEQTAFEGLMYAGELMTITFSIALESVPVTYHGEYLNIDHYIDVRIDIPWKFDSKGKTEFLVLPGANQEIEEPTQPKTNAGCGLFLAFIVGFTGINCVFMGIMLGQPSQGSPALLWAGCVLVALAGLVAFLSLRNSLAERKLGEVKVELGTKIITPNSIVPCEIAFTPLKPIEVTEATAILTGTEVVVSGSGTNKSTYRKILLTQTTVMSDAKLYPPHQPVNILGELSIPDSVAYSFKSNDNSITWVLNILVAIKNYPDWSHGINLTLVPHGHLHGNSSSESGEPSADDGDSGDHEVELPHW